MAVMDEFREEREAIKTAPLNKRIAYFWHYYKLPVILFVVVVVLIISYISAMNNSKEYLLNGIFLNCRSDSEYTKESMIQEYFENQGIDANEYDFEVIMDLPYKVADGNSDYSVQNDNANQTILVYSEAGTLDFITGSYDVLMDIAYKGGFADLSEILTEEEYAVLEPYFLYLDMDVYDQRKAMLNKGSDASDIQIPDCTKKENMKDPVPVIIDMNQSEILNKVYGDSSETLAVGISGNTDDLENTLDFIHYLMYK